MPIRLPISMLILALGIAHGQAPAAAPPRPQDIKLRGDRFAPLTYDQLNAAQKKLIEDALQPPLPTVAGPYNAFLRSPEMGDLAHQFGAYTRFRSSVPTKLNELGIIMAAQFWKAEFIWYAHKRAAIGAGLNPAVADAIAAGKRPAAMQPDEEAVYNFCNELFTQKQVSDATFSAVKARLGEQGVVDLVAGMAYFQFASMLLDIDRYPLPDNVKPELK